MCAIVDTVLVTEICGRVCDVVDTVLVIDICGNISVCKGGCHCDFESLTYCLQQEEMSECDFESFTYCLQQEKMSVILKALLIVCSKKRCL